MDFIVRSFCNYHSGTVGSRVHAVDSCDVDFEAVADANVEM